MYLDLPLRAAGAGLLFVLGALAQSAAGPTSLDELVEHALRRNPEMAAARQRVAEATALLRQAGLAPNPTFEASFTNGDVLGSRGERQFEAAYSQPVETGGRRARRVEAARIEAELASAEIANRERLLRADVKARYVEALAAMRDLANARRVLDLNRQSHELAAARTREGEGAPLEQNLLRVEVNRIDSDRLLFQGQAERAVLELRLLAGLEESEPLSLSEPLGTPTLEVDAGSVAAQAMARRPDIAAARLQEKLAEAELGLARSLASPEVTLTGRYAHSQSRFDQYGLESPGGPVVPLRDRDNMLTAGVSITLPTRNRNQGNIEAAVARARAARLRREALERTVRQETLAAVNRYRSLSGALQVFESGVVGQSQDNVRVVRAAFELGELRLLDVINEQRRLLETQRTHTAMLRDANLAVIELERAAGAPIQ